MLPCVCSVIDHRKRQNVVPCDYKNSLSLEVGVLRVSRPSIQEDMAVVSVAIQVDIGFKALIMSLIFIFFLRLPRPPCGLYICLQGILMYRNSFTMK